MPQQPRDSRTMSTDELLATYTPEQLGRAMANAHCREYAVARTAEIREDMTGMTPTEQYAYLRQNHLSDFQRLGESLHRHNPLDHETAAQSVTRIMEHMQRRQQQSCQRP